jgi:hypothetical protein
MYNYATVSQAIANLKQKGYSEDFNLQENCIVCNIGKFEADEFEIKEVYRFEGASDPADEAIVYGIESHNGIKGVLVNGYGYSSEPMGEAIAEKLKWNAR